MERAKEAVRDDILSGKTIAGYDLAACIDCELNGDGYTGAVHDLAQIILQMHGVEDMTHPEAQNHTWLALLHIAEQIVERHIPERAITKRATERRECDEIAALEFRAEAYV